MSLHTKNSQELGPARGGRRRLATSAAAAGVVLTLLVSACGSGSEGNQVARGDRTDTTQSNRDFQCDTGIDPSKITPFHPTSYPNQTAPLPSDLPKPGPGEVKDFTPSDDDLAMALGAVEKAADLRFLTSSGPKVKRLHEVQWTTSRGKDLGVILEFEASPPVRVPTQYGTIATDQESSAPILQANGMPEVRKPVEGQLVDYEGARIITVYVRATDHSVYAVDASGHDPNNPCGDPLG